MSWARVAETEHKCEVPAVGDHTEGDIWVCDACGCGHPVLELAGDRWFGMRMNQGLTRFQLHRGRKGRRRWWEADR